MIKVSESAAKRVALLMEDDGFSPVNDFVRVGVKSGGCSGLEYELKFDKETTDTDKVFEDNGVKIAVDKKKLPVFNRNHVGILGRIKRKRIRF